MENFQNRFRWENFLIGEQQPIGGTNSSGVEDALSPCAKKIHVQPKDAALAQIMVQRKLFWNWKKDVSYLTWHPNFAGLSSHSLSTDVFIPFGQW